MSFQYKEDTIGTFSVSCTFMSPQIAIATVAENVLMLLRDKLMQRKKMKQGKRERKKGKYCMTQR